MKLVERDDHVQHLERLLADSAAKQGRVALVQSPIASGKTELLRTITEHATRTGFRVLSATCSLAEQALPLGVASQIFRNAELPPQLARRVTGLLCEGAPQATRARSNDDLLVPEMVKVFHGLSVTLLDVSAEAPLLIAIDDLQYVDTPSLFCLLHLVRRLRSARILAVFTENPRSHPAHASCRAELLRQPHLHRIQLDPLSPEGVGRLLATRLGPAVGQPLAAEFFAATGGNPLLLHALIDDRRGSNTGDRGTGDKGTGDKGYGLALLNCLHRGDPNLLHVARALAVLDEDATAAELGELVDLDPEAVERALREMGAAGLLDDGRLRHPAARAAVLDDLPNQELTELHRRAAMLRHSQGAAAQTVARHLVSGADITEGWAVCALVEAANRAVLGDQLPLATTYLEQAQRSSPSEQDRAQIVARLAQVEWQLNPSTATRHFERLVVATEKGQVDSLTGVTLVRQLLWHGRAEEAVGILDELRGLAATHAEAAAEVRDAELWLAFCYPPLAHRRAAAAAPAPHLDAPVVAKTDPWLRCAATLADVLARGQSQSAVEQAEQVVRDLRPGRDTGWAEEAAMLALLVLLHAGKATAAADWWDWLLSEADDRRAPTWQALFASARAEIAIRLGDLSEAASHAQVALAHLAPSSWGVAVALPLGTLILATTRMGNYEDAAMHLTYSVPEAMFESRYGLHYLYARGHYYLATNNRHAALADFLSCGELVRRWGLDPAELVPWRTSAAEAWLRLGNRDQAWRLIQDQLTRPGDDTSRSRGRSLRLLASVSRASRRPQLLAEALDLAEECGDRFEQARVLSDLSHAYHALDKTRRARMVFRRAFHMATMCEATPLVNELLSINSSVTIPDDNDRAAPLTDSERRVASLAVMGYTNHEIALKLYVTASTVEQHLTRVYRKLNVKGRKDLPADMATAPGRTSRADPLTGPRSAAGDQ